MGVIDLLLCTPSICLGFSSAYVSHITSEWSSHFNTWLNLKDISGNTSLLP